MGIFSAAIGWIIQACSPLGKPIDAEISDSYYYSKDEKSVIYSRMGNWFELSKVNMEVDMASFELLSRNFAKDRDQVYFQYHPIPPDTVDVGTFQSQESKGLLPVGTDQHQVFLFQDRKPYVQIIEGADPGSFVQEDWYWARDDHHYFYRHRQVPVERTTFRRLNDFFALDSAQAYSFAEDTLASFEADVATLKKLDSIYCYDKDHLYYFAWYVRREPVFAVRAIPYTSIEEVKILKEPYLQVGDQVYGYGETMEGVDLSSFEVLGSTYAKDQNQVYYGGSPIAGADPESFGYSEKHREYRDKHHSYLEGKPMQ